MRSLLDGRRMPDISRATRRLRVLFPPQARIGNNPPDFTLPPKAFGGAQPIKMSDNYDCGSVARVACILCECNCGIEIQLDGRRFERVGGDNRYPHRRHTTARRPIQPPALSEWTRGRTPMGLLSGPPRVPATGEAGIVDRLTSRPFRRLSALSIMVRNTVTGSRHAGRDGPPPTAGAGK